MANTLATSTDLQQVWFVVSPQNPFKKTKSLLHEFDRLDMVERAIADNSHLKATDIEFSMPKPSYTIDTLDVLTKKFPQHTFRLLMGEDNLEQFANWKQYERILTEFGIYVYPRPIRLAEVVKPGGVPPSGTLPGGILPTPFRNHPNVRLITAPLLDISATYIREAVRANRSIRYMVPDIVEEMIERKKFYV